jgi:hypothetical protein
MPIVPWPTDLADVVEVDFWLEDASVVNISPFDRSREVFSLPPTWRAMMSWGVLKHDRMHRLDAWLHQILPGTGNVAKLPLLKYRTPLGTMAGDTVLFGAHDAGATSLAIDGNTGGAFEAGDFIQMIGEVPQIHQVVVGGVSAISIVPPLWRAYTDAHIVRFLGSGVDSSEPFPLYQSMQLVPPLNPSPMIPGKYSRGRSVEFMQAIQYDTLFVD